MVIKSLILFLLAGLCEIGGGYLVWLWLKEGKPLWYSIIGTAVLVLYGVVVTLHPANFARTYAIYGGIFIVLSLFGFIILTIFIQISMILSGHLLPCMVFALFSMRHDSK